MPFFPPRRIRLRHGHSLSFRPRCGSDGPLLQRQVHPVRALPDARGTLERHQSPRRPAARPADPRRRVGRLAESASSEVARGVLQHELRTPVAAILASSEILDRCPDRDEQTRKRFVGIIRTEADRLKRTLEALFDGLEEGVEAGGAPEKEADDRNSSRREEKTDATSHTGTKDGAWCSRARGSTWPSAFCTRGRSSRGRLLLHRHG